MPNASIRRHNLTLGCVAAVLLGLTPAFAQAQTPSPEATPAPPTDPTPVVPPPAEIAPAAAPAVVAPVQPTIPETVPPPPVLEAPPATPPVVLKEDPRKSPMTMNAWLRLGHRLQS